MQVESGVEQLPPSQNSLPGVCPCVAPRLSLPSRSHLPPARPPRREAGGADHPLRHHSPPTPPHPRTKHSFPLHFFFQHSSMRCFSVAAALLVLAALAARPTVAGPIMAVDVGGEFMKVREMRCARRRETKRACGFFRRRETKKKTRRGAPTLSPPTRLPGGAQAGMDAVPHPFCLPCCEIAGKRLRTCAFAPPFSRRSKGAPCALNPSPPSLFFFWPSPSHRSPSSAVPPPAPRPSPSSSTRCPAAGPPRPSRGAPRGSACWATRRQRRRGAARPRPSPPSGPCWA